MPQFATDLVAACQAEFDRWDRGMGRETWGRPQHSKDYYLFVKEYWMSIGNKKLDGRTVVNGIRPAWSSAFVCHCIKKAGAGSRFFYAEAHCHYISRAMRQADGELENFGYVAHKPDDYKPKIGDIVCGGREYASSYDYEQAKLTYEGDSFYPSHGDIIIEVAPTYVRTIGGNINQNVDEKKLKLTDTGYLRNRINSRNKELPWIAILECLL